MNGCHGNQSCHVIFIKTPSVLSIHCLQNPMKIATELNESMFLKFNDIFPKFTTPIKGQFMI